MASGSTCCHELWESSVGLGRPSISIGNRWLVCSKHFKPSNKAASLNEQQFKHNAWHFRPTPIFSQNVPEQDTGTSELIIIKNWSDDFYQHLYCMKSVKARTVYNLITNHRQAATYVVTGRHEPEEQNKMSWNVLSRNVEDRLSVDAVLMSRTDLGHRLLTCLHGDTHNPACLYVLTNVTNNHFFLPYPLSRHQLLSSSHSAL